jgi:hypothetical protein
MTAAQLPALLRALPRLARLSFTCSGVMLECLEAARACWPAALRTLYIRTDSEEARPLGEWAQNFAPLGHLDECLLVLDSCEFVDARPHTTPVDELSAALAQVMPRASILVAECEDVMFMGQAWGSLTDTENPESVVTRAFWPTLLEAWQTHPHVHNPTGKHARWGHLRAGQRRQDAQLAPLLPALARKPAGPGDGRISKFLAEWSDALPSGALSDWQREVHWHQVFGQSE